MFVYLSKKIAIPNGVKLHWAWNPTTGGWPPAAPMGC